MPVGIEELSERELEILRLVATGASNKEIASRLFISTNTVKVHLRNIFTKIGAVSRTEAAMFAVNNRLVPGIGKIDDVTSSASGESQTNNPSPYTGIEQNISPQKRIHPVWWGFLTIFILLGAVVISRMIQNGAFSKPTPETFTDELRWQEAGEMQVPRYSFAVTNLGNAIYAIGGSTVDGVTGVVEKYDPSVNIWAQAASKTTPVSDISAGVLRGVIYIPGGRLDSGKVTDVLEIYDPIHDAWKIGKSMPVALCAYALATFEGKLYLFGGWDGDRYVNRSFEYDPVSDQWSELAAMPSARGYAGAATAGGKIYVIGGKNENGALAMSEVYSPNIGEENEISWSQASPLPEPRYGMGVTSMVDIIYVVGGKGESLDPLQYIPSLDSWTEFDPPINYPLAYPGLVPYEAFLFLIGGENKQGATAFNQAYQALFTITIPIIR
jgi:DNA-binding CsgD family transcriptional regulator/N-acetylneuraminic acid mutarotase